MHSAAIVVARVTPGQISLPVTAPHCTSFPRYRSICNILFPYSVMFNVETFHNHRSTADSSARIGA